MQREQVDVVVAGGASHVVTLAAGLSTLSTIVDIVSVGGASAGAISAAAEAFAVPVHKQKALLKKVLTRDYLKDRAWNPLDRYGLYAGDNLYKELKDLFGGKTMGEALIPLRVVVCDLWTRQPVVIEGGPGCNPEHAKLKVVDALRCSAAIPVFFKAWTLPEWRGNRLFVDGGTAANFAMGMFDDSPRRTIGLRLTPAPMDDVKPVRSLVAFCEAVASLVLWASDNAHISRKRYADVISLPQIGSGLNFNLTDEVFEERWAAGVAGVPGAQFLL